MPWHTVYRVKIQLECKYNYFFFPPQTQKALDTQACEFLKDLAHFSSHLLPLRSPQQCVVAFPERIDCSTAFFKFSFFSQSSRNAIV